MIRALIVILVATYAIHLSPTEACAHFLFAHVVRGVDPRVELHFAESAWDFSSSERMITLMSPATSVDGSGRPLEFTAEPYALVTPLPAGEAVACAAFTYGLMTRGEPFLLEYHAKGVAGLDAAAQPSDLRAEVVARRRGTDQLDLTVLFDGTPVPDAEVVVPGPARTSRTMTTDTEGTIIIDRPATPLFSIRAMVPETRSGVHQDKPYERVRHYTTLTVHAADEIPSTSDGLAWALFHDTMPHADAGDTPNRTGTFRASTDGVVGQGTLRSDGGSIMTEDPSALRDHDHLATLALLPHPASTSAGTIRFVEPRPVGASARIHLPDLDQDVDIRDRQVESIHRRSASGQQRIDIVDWLITPDGDAYPRSFVITDFDDTGDLHRVTMVDRTYDESVDPPVLSRQNGRRIEQADRTVPVSVRLSDVRAGTGS